MEVLDERKPPLLHDRVHFPRREVMKHTPFELLAVDGTVTDLHLISEDAGIRQSQHGGLFRPEIVRIVQVVNEHQICDLLDHVQRIYQVARCKNVPETVNSVFQFACNHESNPLKVLQFFLSKPSFLFNQHFPLAVSLAVLSADIVLILQGLHDPLHGCDGFTRCAHKFLLLDAWVLCDPLQNR